VKKLLLIFVLAAYSVAAMGINLNYFYCCKKLTSITFSQPQEEKDCTHKTKKGCCDTKTVTVKLKADQVKTEVAQTTFANHQLYLLPTHNYTVDIAFAPTSVSKVLYQKPPPSCFPSIQVLYCVFRI
jgi:hypothetical protein